MAQDPDTIPRRLTDLNNAVADLGSWYMSLKIQPLSLDYFVFMNPESRFENYRANVFQNISAVFQNFFLSFFKDYDSVGSIYENKLGNMKTINVWSRTKNMFFNLRS
jgi:hypothetical protein